MEKTPKIAVKSYGSQNPGKNILLVGAVHGNEHCGPLALEKLVGNIESGEVVVQSGSITCIPIANPKAYKANKRFCDENLGRCFYEKKDPAGYEQGLVQELIPYMQHADIILDLHSMGPEGQPFVFQDYATQECRELALSTGLSLVVRGWPDLYVGLEQQDLSGYAHSIGIPSVVVECGQHNTPEENLASAEVAYKIITQVLSCYGFLKGSVPLVQDVCVSNMKQLITKQKEGSFVKKRKHGELIKKGEKILTYDDATHFYAPYDAVMILPKLGKRKIGDERFYLGVEG